MFDPIHVRAQITFFVDVDRMLDEAQPRNFESEDKFRRSVGRNDLTALEDYLELIHDRCNGSLYPLDEFLDYYYGNLNTWVTEVMLSACVVTGLEDCEYRDPDLFGDAVAILEDCGGYQRLCVTGSIPEEVGYLFLAVENNSL